MKNLITITALIAAGAIAANAATTTLPEPEWTALTLTAPSGTLSSGNSGFSWSGYTENDLTNSWQLSFDWTSTNTNNTIDLFGTSTGGGGAAGIVLQWKHEDNGTLQFGTKGGSDGVSLTDITKPTTGSGTTVVLTYLKSSDSSTSSVLKLKVADKEVTVTAPTANTTFLGNGGASTGNTRLWTNSGKDTYSNISLKYGGAVSPAVPEPSAFGLLAGLGALALVGARRRRR